MYIVLLDMMRALAHIRALPSLYNLHFTLFPYKVFGVVVGEKFCIDIDNSATRYYYGKFFFFSFFFIIQVLVIWSLCLCV